jgi:type III secretion protein F
LEVHFLLKGTIMTMTIGVVPSSGSDGGLTAAVQNLMKEVGTQSSNLKTNIDEEIQGKAGGLEQEDVLKLQFDIGQYNALLEAASSIAKGTTDMLKTLAQRTS